MSRRLANLYLHKVKVGDRYSKGWNDACEKLQDLLAQFMLPAARRRFVNHGEQTAYAAALIGMDRVRACRMFHDSHKYEQTLLTDASRRVPPLAAAVDNVAAPPQVEVGKPLWYDVLVDLIVLSHRSWLYLTLFTARSAPRRQGRLADIYLGRTRAGGPRDALLVHDKHRLKAILEELEEAFDNRCADASAEPIEKVLYELDSRQPRDLEQAASGTSDLCASRSTIVPSILALLHQDKRRQPHAVYQSGRYPTLAVALNHVAARLAEHSQTLALAPGAAQELCQERHAPGSVLSGSRTLRIADLLKVRLDSPDDRAEDQDAILADHRDENDPQEVLAAIAVEPIASATRESGDDDLADAESTIPRSILLPLLCAKLQLRSPEWALHVSLMLCYGLDEACSVLRNWLPGPAQMLPPNCGWLEQAQRILVEWKALLAMLAPPVPRNREHFVAGKFHFLPNWQEIPRDVRTQPERIDSAILVVDQWLRNPALAPTSWRSADGEAVVPDDVEPVIRGALFVVLTAQLQEDLTVVYRAAKWLRKLDLPTVLAMLVLGQNWVNQSSWPPPEEVAHRLDDLLG